MMKRFDENLIFGEWLQYWYTTYKAPHLAKNTLRNIEQMIRIHTPEWLKNKPIRDISVFDIDEALSAFPACRTRTYLRQTWQNAFLMAQKREIVVKNPVALSDNIRYKKQRGKALTITEQTAFIASLKGKSIEPLMLFYLHSGVRRNEALSLLWQDIDYDEQRIYIRGTKTAESDRFILLTDELREIFDLQRKQGKDGATVFPYAPAYVSQAFKKLCPNHHLHDLRHTYITRCAECGVNVSVCQSLVGHSTPTMTMSIYTHVFDDFKRKEASKFALFPPARS